MKCEMHARHKKPHAGHSSKAQQANNPSMTPGKSNEPPRVRTMHLSDGHQKRFERVETVTPQGFQPLLDKILRAVLNARPLHVLMFVAEYLDAEISRRTFDDMCYGCQLKKSLRDPLYPSESCKCLGIMPPPDDKQDGKSAEDDSHGGIDAFMTGLIKERHLCAPALDRYKQLSSIGSFSALLGTSGDAAVGDGGKSATSMALTCAGYRLRNCTCAFCAMQAITPASASAIKPGGQQQGRGRCQGGNASVLYDVFTDAPVAHPLEFTGAGFTVHDDDGPGQVLHREPSFGTERLFVERAADSMGVAPGGQSNAFDDKARPHYLLDERQFMEQFVDRDNMICDLIARGLVGGDPAAQDTSINYGMLSFTGLSGPCVETDGGGGGYGAAQTGDGPVPYPQIGETFTVFGDQPLYAQPPSRIKVFEGVTLKPGEPFGPTFQGHVPFDDKFKPEQPVGVKPSKERNDSSYMKLVLPDNR